MTRWTQLPLHIQIFISMFLGFALGIAAVFLGAGGWVLDWVKPFGDIFVRMLKLIAVPIVLFSLIDGITNLKGLTGLSRIGLKTLGLYLATTVLAICIGLLIVNSIAPGKYVSEEKRQIFKEKYISAAQNKLDASQSLQTEGPLRPLPTNGA